MSYPKQQQEFCLRWNNHQVNLLNVFKEILDNCSFSDVTLVTEDGPTFIRCHKVVLASCSDYFASLFIHLPSHESHPFIVLKDIQHKEMKALVEYMYQGEVYVAQDQLPLLLRIAEILQIKGLTDESKLKKNNNKQQQQQQQQQQQPQQQQQSPRSPRSPRSSRSTRSPPPSISTSTNISGYQNSSIPNGYTSPPLCTSSSYYPFNSSNRSPRLPRNLSPRTIENSLMYNNLLILPSDLLQQHHQLQQQQQQLAEQHALAQSIAARSTPIFPGYENSENKMRKQMSLLGMNRDTPILRTVLGQGHADSSQSSGIIHADNNDTSYRSPSNGSANDTHDDIRSSTEHSHTYNNTSPQTSDHSLLEEDDKKPINLPGPNPKKGGKQEWKRYKQYSRKNISDAIEAVRSGMSALKAATLFHVPSRTLYDKVKKLGISTPRPFRRNGNLNNSIGNNSSSACFPYGMGGNANGSIYASMNSGNDSTTNIIDNPTALLETTYSQIRENSTERDTVSMSPNNHQTNDNDIDDNDQVEDLSITRKSDVRVIMQTPTIKEEIINIPEDFSRR
ncbi:broad-complex core protein-like [Aphidius gifuensis]|uniref:broad-complex core protein-like n=1 Tax=Aphidius gifuensis TaxID=684658 RepID=UPI001CDC6E47|nr:broad-complex core protein-like [Aphidius gifuensis]